MDGWGAFFYGAGMKLLPAFIALFASCALPHYVEVAASYGRGALGSSLDHEYGSAEIRAGYVVKPLPVIVRTRYTHDHEDFMPGLVPPLALGGGDVGNDGQEVSPVRKGEGPDDDGGGAILREGASSAGEAPWWGRAAFLAPLGTLIVGIIGAFYHREIRGAGRKVFKKKPTRGK